MNRKHPLILFFCLLGRYLRTYWAFILLALAPCGIFYTVHWLAWGEVGQIYYALLLCGGLLGCAFLYSFVRFSVRQLNLWRALEQLPPDPMALPRAHGALEQSYRKLAQAYSRETRRQEDSSLRLEQERTDYYTLWVHQIKTPIAALNLIAQSQKDIDRAQLQQEIYKMEQYAEAALSYQRLSSLSEDVQLESVSLYPLCCGVVKKLRPLFGYRRISLSIEPFSDKAVTDSKWLSMALEQVLTNALKYTPEGGRIAIGIADGQRLTVTDTGIGIRPEDVPRVFSRGFTGQTGRTHGKSTGIGLYLCKQACDKLGHKVSLTSEVGVGTTVTFDLRREDFEAF